MAAAESSNPAELPRFAERLANLRIVLQKAIQIWENLPTGDSYLPIWETLHQEVHSLKGVSKILSASIEEKTYIDAANECIRLGVRGEMIFTNVQKVLPVISDWLEAIKPDSELPDNPTNFFNEIRAQYKPDLPHSERVNAIGTQIPYVDEIVSKRWRECIRGNYTLQIWEQDCKLLEIPQIRKTWEEKIGRGFIINFLPLISTEGSRQVHLKVWVALRK